MQTVAFDYSDINNSLLYCISPIYSWQLWLCILCFHCSSPATRLKWTSRFVVIWNINFYVVISALRVSYAVNQPRLYYFL